MFVVIAPFNQSFDDIWFIYEMPINLESELKIWHIVSFPIKETMSYWVVYQILWSYNEIKERFWIDIPFESMKKIQWIQNNNIFLNHYTQKLLPFMAEYYFSHIHHISQILFPKNLREKVIKNTLKFEKTSDYKYIFNYNNSLNIEQTKAFHEIKKSNKNTNLLFWLTGSWKTEIYIAIIKENLDNNKQTLLLIPEIILTNQISDKIKRIFWEDVLVINSTVSDAKKTQYWIDIYHSKAKIIIGTRSALFYPYNNLSTIIIDEEHDQSYLSDNTPRYKTIEVAKKISQWNNSMLLLGSGTPSIETMYQASKWEYWLIYMLKRYQL